MKNKISTVLNKKGISLVELLLAMSILVVIGGAITTFMITGTNSYTRNSNEVNMQYEAQLASNMINDLLVDATKDVTFIIDDPANPAVVKEAAIDNTKKKWLRILNTERNVVDDGAGDKKSELTYRVDELYWDPDDLSLSYSRYAAIDTDGDGVPDDRGTMEVNNDLLAEHVDSFSVDMTEAVNNKNIKVMLHFQNKDKEFAASGNVTLRNHLSINTNVIIASSAGTIDDTATINGVVVYPARIILQPGQAAVFSATVTGSGLVEQDVTWGITPGNDPDTKIYPNGKVEIGSAETINSLTVTATSKKDPSKSGYADISIKKIVDPIGINSSKDSISKKDTFTLTPVFSTDCLNIDLSSPVDTAVTWSVQDGAEFITNNGAPNIFYVSPKCPVGTRITIVATSVLDKTKSGTKSFVTVAREGGESGEGDSDEEESGNSTITISNWPSEIKRGGSGTFTAAATGTEGCFVTFDVVAKDDAGNEISSSFYSGSQSGNSYTVNLNESYGYKKGGKIEVTAYLVENGRTKANYKVKTSRVAIINPVSLKLSTNKNKAYETNIEKQYIYATQAGGHKVYYELLGIVDKDIDWKMSPSGVLAIHQDSDDKYFSLSAQGMAKSGDVTAKAYLGSYFLGNVINANVSGGNILFYDSYYKEVEFFLPLPEASKVQGAPDYTVSDRLFSREKGGKHSKDQWGNWDNNCGYDNEASFKIENVKYTFYIYYKYDKFNGIWYCTVANKQYPDDDMNNWWLNSSGTFKKVLGAELSNSWATVLKYDPKNDAFWHP